MDIENNDNNAHKMKLSKALEKKANKTEIFHRNQHYFIPMTSIYFPF